MTRFYVNARPLFLDDFSTSSTTVGYDNEPTDSYENFMFFDTKEDAEKWIESDDAKSWKCTFDIIEDEIMTEDESMERDCE